jgi:hypothetical protein
MAEARKNAVKSRLAQKFALHKLPSFRLFSDTESAPGYAHVLSRSASTWNDARPHLRILCPTMQSMP